MSASVDLLRDRDIEEKVIALVVRARELYGLPLRCRAEAAREAIGLGLRRGRLKCGTDGALWGKTMVVSADIEMQSRYEYTIFHEIIHHLLEEDEGSDLIDYLTEVHHNDPAAYDRAIERCCQIGAAEFMIPRAQARAIIADEGFSVDLVEKLAGLNGASIAAAAVQLAILAPVDCYVVVCVHGISPIWPHNLGLHVEQARRRDEMLFPIACGTMIPDDHLFARVWATKERAAGPSYVPFKSGKTYPCEHAEAKMVGNQLVGILYQDHPRRRGQLGLGLVLN